RDDGRGGAAVAQGTGLLGLKDRAEALGGRIFLDSPPGSGTTLRLELPLSTVGLGKFRCRGGTPGGAPRLSRG
ncbi:MAG: hypothetical protein QOG57_2322, partial [Pseudonocardiales bacterium]|nr:hypothetical protein [Pseudonocardiales bacterium]